MSTQHATRPSSPPRVLTPDLTRRLTQVNDAIRALRALGCAVRGQDLRLGTSQRPQLRIGAPPARVLRECSGCLQRMVGAHSTTQWYYRDVELVFCTAHVSAA